MKIFNTEVYGLAESIIRSGYPMRASVGVMDNDVDTKDMVRAMGLGSCLPGTGHDSFLTGIIVQMDIEAPAYVWPQLQRYHFLEFISSMSKMHRITKMDLQAQCCRFVDPRTIDLLHQYMTMYAAEPTRDNFERILANAPQGLELTAGMTTNYRQIKTMYKQREHHRLSFWTDVFIPWADELPRFRELCLGDRRGG